MAKKTVYLHIGTFKTGTSSLQAFMADNAEKLAENGLFVPTGALKYQYVLPLSLIKEHTDWRGAWPNVEYSAEFYWDELQRQMRETECSRILLSTEYFCDFIHVRVHHKKTFFADMLRETFSPYNVKIIVYLKNIADYLFSLYREIIKVSSHSFLYQDFLAGEIKSQNFHASPILFLTYFADIFGKHSLIVKKYDKNSLFNANIVDDILSLIDKKYLQKGLFNTKYIKNESLSPVSAELKGILNEFNFPSLAFHTNISSKQIHAVKRKKTLPVPPELLQQLKQNMDAVYREYNIDISSGIERLGEEQNQNCVSEETTFIVLLLAQITKQLKDLEGKVEKLLKERRI